MTIRRLFPRPLGAIVVAAASLAVVGCSHAPRTEGGSANLSQAVTATDPSDAPSWPTDSQWVAVTQGNAYLQDPARDKQGESDVVGDATHPAIYAWADAQHVYWRLRVNGDPVAHAGWPELNNALWVCVLDTDGVANTYEWLLWVNGKTSTPDTVEIWQNSSTQTFDSPSDKPETLSSSLNIKNTSNAHARVVLTSTTSSPSSFASASKADPDYFVDAAFDRSVLAGLTGSTPIRLACGTSATAQGLNADFTSISNATTLSTLFSDAMLFGDGGVSTCNSVTACGPTCGACSGATPICGGPTKGCQACDGDNGTGTANACPSSKPFCAADGSCGSCAGTADCTSGTAIHGGAICSNGACQDSCANDSDCGSSKWCSGGHCTAKLGNGVETTSDAAHDAGCPTIGGAECTSGFCDPADNACGWADGDGSCDSSSAAAVCRSGNCGAASGTCLPTGGCRLDGDCASGESCDLETYTCAPIASPPSDPPSDPTPPSDPPSDPIVVIDPPPPSDPVSAPAPSGCANDYTCSANDYCNDTHSCTPKAPNGELPSGNSCTRATQCSSGACGGDGICGFTAGSSCTSNDACRSQVCDPHSQRCVQCAVDAQCNPGLACVAGGCRHRVANGELCARPQQCISGVCGSDGMCGGVDGELCGGGDACRSGLCSAGVCTEARGDGDGKTGKPVRIPPGGDVDLGSSENGASASFSSDLNGNGSDLEAGGGGGLSCSVGWGSRSQGTNVGGLLAAALAALAISRRRRAS